MANDTNMPLHVHHHNNHMRDAEPLVECIRVMAVDEASKRLAEASYQTLFPMTLQPMQSMCLTHRAVPETQSKIPLF